MHSITSESGWLEHPSSIFVPAQFSEVVTTLYMAFGVIDSNCLAQY